MDYRLPVVFYDKAAVLALGFTLAAVYISARIAYNLFFHPLRTFPGPVLYRTTSMPWAYYMLKGRLAWQVSALHDRYGPVVRIAPNELSFLELEAWKEVYSVRPGGVQLEKYIKFYKPSNRFPRSIITAAKEDHAVLRKLLAPGFSDKAMREQEPVIGTYVDLLIHRLGERCQSGTAALDMRDWYNFTTFDVIGKLTFGEDFGCLEGGKYHPWVAAIMRSIREGGRLTAINALGFRSLVSVIARPATKSRAEHAALVQMKLTRRIERGSTQPDLIGRLIDKKDEINLELPTLQANSSAITIAGSETTATLLTGITYLLLTHKEIFDRLTTEIRSSFKNSGEITLTSVKDLTFMLACLNEALRFYPPAPGGLPRVVPEGGAAIAGRFVPGNTVVSVWQLAIHRSKRFFKLPDEFHPERFLGDPDFASDKLDAVQPFSVGPRNCIGRSLAYAEMRLILAKIVFNFDMKLAEESRNWINNNRLYTLWFKPELHVYPTPASARGSA